MNQSPDSKFAKLRALGPDEWRWLIAALILLPLAGMSLRLVGYQRTYAYFSRFIPTGLRHQKTTTTSEVTHSTEQVAWKIAHMVMIAANHGLYRGNCLRQGLAGWLLLNRNRIHAELKIGIKKDQDGFAAHAWVVWQEKTLLGGEAASELYRDLRLHS